MVRLVPRQRGEMPRGRGSIPRRGAEDLRREDDHLAEGLQRAPSLVQQASVRPPHPSRLHDRRSRRADLAQPEGRDRDQPRLRRQEPERPGAEQLLRAPHAGVRVPGVSVHLRRRPRRVPDHLQTSGFASHRGSHGHHARQVAVGPSPQPVPGDPPQVDSSN